MMATVLNCDISLARSCSRLCPPLWILLPSQQGRSSSPPFLRRPHLTGNTITTTLKPVCCTGSAATRLLKDIFLVVRALDVWLPSLALERSSP